MSDEAGARARVEIRNRLGLHARAARLFVQKAGEFAAEITVRKDGEVVSGKSIMGLMMLAAGKGSTIVVEASGPDADDAVAALRDLVELGFYEDADEPGA